MTYSDPKEKAMADIQYYERVIKAARKSKKLAPRLWMIGLYALILGAFLIIAVRVGVSASLLMLIPFSLLTIALLTWKYTSVEFEYSFTAGTFTFSKIYSGSKRKCVFEGDLRELESVFIYDEHKLEHLGGKLINAIPDTSSQNPCVAVFVENDSRICVVFDCDRMSAKIIRYFNPSAIDRDVFKKLDALEAASTNE